MSGCGDFSVTQEAGVDAGIAGSEGFAVVESLKTFYPEGEPLQAFTAIGQVTDDEPYQADMKA